MPTVFRWFAALGLVLGLAALPLLGQQSSKKYALLVGVNQYQHRKLPNLRYAVNDATALAQVLRQGGYQVTLLTREDETTKSSIETNLTQVLKACRRGDLLVIGLAGHGLQFAGKADAFFCPSDAIPLADETQSLVSLAQVYRGLEKSFATSKLLLVDACRDDPNAARGTRGIGGGAGPAVPTGVAALFSCKQGQKAFEHQTLGHGVFFHHVLEGLRGSAKDDEGQVRWDGLVAYVRRRVPQGVKQLIDREAAQNPTLTVTELEDSPVLLTLAAGGTAGTQSKLIAEVGKPWKNSIGMELMYIPPGKFTMGSPKNEEGRDDEEDQHEVEITRGFWLGKHEVTYGQFRKFVEAEKYQTECEKDGKGGHGYDGKGAFAQKPEYSWRNAGFAQTEQHPIVNVTWEDANAFCRWLSKQEGATYALPTEAQWEYSCRGKTTTRFHQGDRDAEVQKVGNIADAALKAKLTNPSGWEQAWNDGHPFTAPVGRFPANAFGLHDMHGNVFEWCQDWYEENYYQKSPRQDPVNTTASADRVLRGGSWVWGPVSARSAFRNWLPPASRFGDLGFRVVLLR